MMERLICWLIKRLVNLHYKRTHFYAWSWGIDENTDINILSEESYLNYHRYGTKETTSNASQRIQSVESVKSVENNGDIIVRSNLEPFKVVDTPQTDVPRCSINGTPFDECGFCEHFNCDTCQCEADTPQTDCEACELDGKADVCKICRVSNYEPQTDCGWK